MSNNITFVTAFHNIGRKTDAPLQKLDNYPQWINQLLAQPINIYFFISAEMHALLDYEHRDNLIFKIEDDIPYFDRLDDIRESWQNYSTNNPEKDTPEFAAIMSAKFVYVKRVIEENPFNDSHYAWIDAGLLKVATNPELLPLLEPHEKIRCILMNYISNEEILQPSFTKACRYKIPGGLVTGSKEYMEWFCDSLIKLADELLDAKQFGLEQEHMAIIYRRNPDKFDPYYGDFCDLIRNYDHCCNNGWLPMRVFNMAIMHQDHQEAFKVADYLRFRHSNEISLEDFRRISIYLAKSYEIITTE